jgi:hypothetical protein
VGAIQVRIKFVRWAGLVLLVGSLIPLTGWTVWDETRTWDLARDTPISLAEGSHFSTGVSRVNMSARYGIVIYVSDAVVDQFDTLHDQLECQMGVYSWPQGPTSVLSPKCKQPPLLRARWVLREVRVMLPFVYYLDHDLGGSFRR